MQLMSMRNIPIMLHAHEAKVYRNVPNASAFSTPWSPDAMVLYRNIWHYSKFPWIFQKKKCRMHVMIEGGN